jgi:hypothetical protein
MKLWTSEQVERVFGKSPTPVPDRHTITITLPSADAEVLGSTDGTLTFDLPLKGIIGLAAIGLQKLAADSALGICYDEQDPFDNLWEKLDAISKD